MNNVEDLDAALKYIRKHADHKETKYKYENRHGHKLASIRYYSKSNGIEFAKVYKTNNTPHQVSIIDDLGDEYVFTLTAKQKVRPL